MPGFLVGSRKIDVELKNRFPERCVQESLDLPRQTAKRNTLNKFMGDKVLAETPEAIMVLEGYLLNKTALFSRYSVSSAAELMDRMYRENGDAFFADFRGEFSGAFYDKALDKWLVFTNHTGTNPVFYAETGDGFFAGSQVNYLTDSCKRSGMKLHFDESAAYQMLTYGFMATNATYAKEIRRLRGGSYFCFQDGKGLVKRYHTLQKNTARFETCSEQELIDAVDHAFRAATKLAFDKDLEYGYGHLADLSGGLDSRMAMWVPHEMGYGPIQLLTYCKADYTDEKVAKEIARYWKDPLLIQPLDDAAFLYDIDEITFLNGGLSLYSGISGGNRMLRSLNMDNFGLEHTGMHGDVVIGSRWKNGRDMAQKRQTGRYSNKLAHRLSQDVLDYIASFEDYDLFLDYTRGFQGAANTYLIRKNYTEASSPFLDVELMQLCLDIPQEFRFHHSLYKKWILAKYPDAAQFKWEKTGAKITESAPVGTIRFVMTRGPKKLLRLLGKEKWLTHEMVPMAYWMEHDGNLRSTLDHYAAEGFAHPPAAMSEQLLSDMQWLYTSGNANEKAMVLTVLAAAKLYFGNE